MAIKKLLDDFEKNPHTKILAVDTSTTGIAWTCLHGGELAGQGKIVLKQKDIVDKLAHIYVEWKKLLNELDPNWVMVEKSIFVKNPDTARKLSFVVGMVAGMSRGEGLEVMLVEPSTWKAWLGYTNLSSKFVQQAKEKLGATEGKKFCDGLRKSQTWRVIQHNFPQQATGSLAQNDHDIADSWGIGLWAHNLVGEELRLEKSREVALDLALLSSLGLSL